MNRLKELRKEKRLTLRDLAGLLKIGKDSLTRMENETQSIADEQLRSFAKFYGVSSDYILGLSNYRNYPVDEPKDEIYQQIIEEVKDLDDFGYAMFGEVKELKDMSKEEKEDFLTIVRVLKKQFKDKK